MTHPYPKRSLVPKVVLMKSGIKTLNIAGQNFSKAAVSVNTARPINTAYPRPTVNSARTASNVFNRAHSHVRRPFNKSTTNKNSNLNEKVNTVKGNVTTTGPKAVVSDNKGNEANVVKASACWVWRPKQKVLDHGNPQLELQEKGVIDSGCSRHMTGNKSYLSDYEEIDGGFVAFGGDPKGGRITGKGKISTGKLDFEDVYFVKELKVPRKDNMYSVDLKNIVPSGGLTCLFAKATLDESNLWHRRLGHINFKTMNKLVRGNLASVLLRRTRIIEKNMHVKFSEDTPNIARNGPNWLFDIDDLTKSMNYEPVIAGNQSNGSADPSFSSSSKGSPDARFKPSRVEEKKDAIDPENEDTEVPNTEEPRVNQEQDANVNNTKNINTISQTVNAANIENNVVDENIVYGCDDDPNMLNLEEIVYSDDDEGVDAKADMTNLDTHILFSPTLTTRIHKDHPLEQIIRDIHSAPQTRRMTKNVTEHVEPKMVIQALQDPSWIEAMQEELLQFKLQQVCTLMDLPHGKRAIVARIEVISCSWLCPIVKTLLYIRWMVKSGIYIIARLKRNFNVCKLQRLGFEDPEFPDRVYKVEKALYGLHQAPRAWIASEAKIRWDFFSQDKYVDEILKKVGFSTMRIASTPVETSKLLLKDAEAEDIDVHFYRSMIGSLMYLTAFRPDIMFVDSPFDLEAYTDCDYAGASLDRKSTIRGCQFLGSRLISWQCKKQTVVANSTTEAELMTGMDWKFYLAKIRVYTGNSRVSAAGMT
ncbi:ribonuclease H-like domain-containing protein [Tanacetum coccineum]